MDKNVQKFKESAQKELFQEQNNLLSNLKSALIAPHRTSYLYSTYKKDVESDQIYIPSYKSQIDYYGEREKFFKESGKWDMSQSQVFETLHRLDLKNYEIFEQYNGLSDFVVILIPQRHSIILDNNKVFFNDDIKKSQKNIITLLDNLERNDVSNVHFIEASDNVFPSPQYRYGKAFYHTKVKGSHVDTLIDDPNYYDRFIPINIETDIKKDAMPKSLVALKNDLQNYSDGLAFLDRGYIEKVDETLQFTPSVMYYAEEIFGKQFLKISINEESLLKLETYIKSNNISELTEEEADLLNLQNRNRQILSNIITVSGEVPAPAFTFAFGRAHFDDERMGGDQFTMQNMLKEQGISYVLLKDKNF